jgi:tubulin monoglycylase TTLL3/8
MECDNHQLSYITAGLLDPQHVDECKNHSELNANNIHSCDCNSITVPQTKYLPSTYKSSLISAERLNELRRKVQEAIRQHKVFTVRGCYHTVRKSLTERGWVEKSDWYKVKNYGNGNGGGGGCYLLEDFIQHLPPRRPGETKLTHIAKCERNIMSRFLEHSSIDLLWTARREKSDISDVSKNQTLIINRFCKAPFTSKEGICAALKDFHWYYEDGINFPRCYNVWNPEELNDFVENFRLTSCIGLLRWLVEHGMNDGFEKVVTSDGRK